MAAWRYYGILATALAGLAWLANASGETERSTLIFNIGVGGYPPYTIKADNAHVDSASSSPGLHGIFWEVLSKVAARHNYQLKAIEIPTKRVEDFLLEGRADLTMRAREWVTNPERFVFTDPILVARDTVFTRASQPLGIDGPEDLRGKFILTRLGYHYPSVAHLFDSGAIQRLELQDEIIMFRHLLDTNRFDGLIADRRFGLWLIKRQGWEGKFRHEKTPLDETDYRLMLPPRNAEFARLFDQELARMKASGELEAIFSRYQ